MIIVSEENSYIPLEKHELLLWVLMISLIWIWRMCPIYSMKMIVSDISSSLSKNFQENIHYFTNLNSDMKANVAERVIKTAKSMMYRYFITQRTHRWKEVLQEIVKNYNATPRRSLNNIAPKDVNKNNEV